MYCFRRGCKNNFNICIIYNMPAKINMFLSNGNYVPQQPKQTINIANLAGVPAPTKQVNTSLNNSMISRIHNARPGCGSCGRKG